MDETRIDAEEFQDVAIEWGPTVPASLAAGLTPCSELTLAPLQVDENGYVIVSAEQWDALNARLDRLEVLLVRLQPGSVPHLRSFTGDSVLG